MPVGRLGSPTFSVTIPLSVNQCTQSYKKKSFHRLILLRTGIAVCVPAAIPAPVSWGSPASVVLRPVPSTLWPGTPVWTPPPIFPLTRKFYFVPITVAAVAIALLPVVIVAIPSFWRPPVVHGFLIFVRAMP